MRCALLIETSPETLRLASVESPHSERLKPCEIGISPVIASATSPTRFGVIAGGGARTIHRCKRRPAIDSL